jgi:hypothetical protein
LGTLDEAHHPHRVGGTTSPTNAAWSWRLSAIIVRDALTGVTIADLKLWMYESAQVYRRIAKAHPQVYRLMFGPNLSDPALRNPDGALDALVDTIMYAQVAGIRRPAARR